MSGVSSPPDFSRSPDFDLDHLLSPNARRSSEYEAIWRWVVEQDKLLPDQSRMTIAEKRLVRRLIAARWNADPPEVEETRLVSAPGLGEAPPVSCEWHRPFDARPGAILFLHGGGWVFGELRSHARLARAIAIATRRSVLVADYRLAPERPFPAPLDDARAAWRWLVAEAARDPRLAGPLAVAGDSAGANLGLALTLAETAARRPGPACGLFFYGVYRGDLDSPSYRRFAEGYGLGRAGMEAFWKMYAGAPDADGRWRDPLLSPLDASDEALAALPPLHLAPAQLDPLLCDSLFLAERLRRIGRPYRLVVHEGVQHGFAQMSARLEEARRAIRLAADLYRTIAGEAPPLP